MKSGAAMTALFVIFLLMFASNREAGASDDALLVIPSRIRVLQLGFDIASGRQVRLVAYQGAPGLSMLFHVWSGSDWVRISRDSLNDLSFLGGVPGHVVLIGDDSMVSEELVNILSGHRGFLRVPSVDAAEILNSLREPLDLGQGDLLWFAQRYELDMVDLNAGKRRNTRTIPRSQLPPEQSTEHPSMPPPGKIAPAPVEVKPF